MSAGGVGGGGVGGAGAVPRWIVAYMAVMLAIGVVIGVVLLFNADEQFAGVSGSSEGRFALGLLVARTAGFGALLVIGLAWRHPAFIIAVFAFRLVTDVLDVAFTLVAGFERDAAGDPLGVLGGGLSPIEPGVLNVVLYGLLIASVFIIPLTAGMVVLVRGQLRARRG